MDNGITFTLDEIQNEFSEKNETALELKVDSFTDLTEEVNTPPVEVVIEEEASTEENEVIIPQGKTSENIVKLAKELLGVETIFKPNADGEDVEVSLEDANLSMNDLVELVNTKKTQELDDIKLNSVSVKKSIYRAVKT